MRLVDGFMDFDFRKILLSAPMPCGIHRGLRYVVEAVLPPAASAGVYLWKSFIFIGVAELRKKASGKTKEEG